MTIARPMVRGIARPMARPLLKGVGGSLASLLFGHGEDGFLFGNWSELDELFTTSIGPTNVASDSDPAGLALDDHSWGANSLAQVLAAQPELITNGTFDTDLTGWSAAASSAPSTVVWSAGAAVTQTDGIATARLRSTITTVVGKTYRVLSTGTAGLQVGTSAGAADILGGGVNTTRYFTAVGTTTHLSIISATNGLTLDNVSAKEVPGNHALNATAGQRPLWRANSGKPYLSFDGSDDRVVSPFIPSSACTLAVACRFPATDASSRAMIGGGASTGNKRCLIGKNATDGKVVAGWGSETLGVGWGADLGISDHVIALTGDAVSRDIWVDGVLIDSRAPTGGPDGTGGGLALGAYNNNGTISSNSAGNLYAALALNRRATPADIARITSDFQRTYQ